jgi:hypothetical protein
MKMKKTAWSPIAIGMASAALIIAAAEANFFIPLGPDTSMGIGELFTTLSAAIGGPIASLTTIFVAYGVVGMLHPEYFPDQPSLYIILEDAIAHLSAMLMVVLIYTKFLYPRARRTGFFLAGWFLLVCAYYFLALLPLSVVFLNLIDPSRGATYFDFARGFLPEVLGTAIITTLIWLAAPIRYRRPLWIGQDIVPDQDTE